LLWWGVNAPSARAQAKKTELTIPEPETVTVETKDGVSIRCTYYPGGYIEQQLPATEKDKDKGKSKAKNKVEQKPGKDVVPIIMLHGWEGRRSEYDGLATFLQRQGHAVIALDLRGHGDSSNIKLPNGKAVELDRMRSGDLESMLLDIDAAKKFLMDKNNEGKLNIEMLCLVGSGFGGNLALNWAAYDWSRQALPAFKQGRDVKAVVLISPEQSFKGVTLNKALTHPFVQRELSLLLVYGDQERSPASDAQSIYSRLEKHRNTTSENPADRDLIKVALPTSLQGTRMLNARLPVVPQIAAFIGMRLANRKDSFAWAERKSPLGD